MYNRIREQLLRFLRVPADPEPPFGAPGSVRTFRAGRNYYYVRLIRWGVAQIGAAIGILVSVGFLTTLTSDVENYHARKALAKAAAPSSEVQNAPQPTNPAAPASATGVTTSPERTSSPAVENTTAPTEKKKSRRARNSRDGYAAFVSRVPMWLVHLMNLGELLGIALFVAQIPLTFIAARLEYELRWYIVTDRSLRIRAGLWSLQESTMSFANLQQVEVRQGPLQRLLGIADVRVQSAGGGGGGETKGHESHDSLHTGVLEGVDHASELRDLILARLKQFREAGLGDPDETPSSAAMSAPPLPSPLVADADATAAARELLEEARALRRALS